MDTLPKSVNNDTDKTEGPRARSLMLDFDVGHNTSFAWTNKQDLEPSYSPGATAFQDLQECVAHLHTPSSYVIEDSSHQNRQPALATHSFYGRAESDELSEVEIGDRLYVLQEHALDGWSLVCVSSSGKIGLLPFDCYTYIHNDGDSALTQRASKVLSLQESYQLRDSSPRPEAPSSSSADSITSLTTFSPQLATSTSDWIRAFALPSFRQSILGGKSFNRFSSFVTSGAETWILSGDAGEECKTESTREGNSIHERNVTSESQIEGSSNEVDRHYIDVGPAWVDKIPSIKILVHSPVKRTDGGKSFVSYTVTTFSECNTSDVVGSYPLTVHRRFSHFVLLHSILLCRLPAIALPPLPEKQYTGRISTEFIEARTGDLGRYMEKLAAHPVIRYAEIFTLFLSCDNDTEWQKHLSRHSSLPSAGASFFANVYYPAFNIDLQDAEEASKGFYNHLKANSLGIQRIRNVFSNTREARIEMSKAERLLAHSLLSLIAPNKMEHSRDVAHHTQVSNEGNDTSYSWCWRVGCKECSKIAKGILLTADSLRNVADLYDDHARRTQLATHEYLKNMAHADRVYEGIVGTHESTLSRYKDAIGIEEIDTDVSVASRCETVLNTTMAEMDTHHQQKVQEFHTLTMDHLDGEIAFYEKVLTRLKATRNRLSGSTNDELGDSPLLVSRYEKELDMPRGNEPPLPQPSAHVFD